MPDPIPTNRSSGRQHQPRAPRQARQDVDGANQRQRPPPRAPRPHPAPVFRPPHQAAPAQRAIPRGLAARWLLIAVTATVIGGIAAGIVALVIHTHQVAARQTAQQQEVCTRIFTPQDFVAVLHKQPTTITPSHGSCSYELDATKYTVNLEVDIACGSAAQSKWAAFKKGSTHFGRALHGARLQYHSNTYAWQDWAAALTKKGEYLEVSPYIPGSKKHLENKTATILKRAYKAETAQKLCP